MVSSLVAELDEEADNTKREDMIRKIAGAAYAGELLEFFLSFCIDRNYRWRRYCEFGLCHTIGFVYLLISSKSVSSAGALIHALLLHPEVQKKAREELDRVVGQDRLPTLEDQPNLPYITAIFREGMRSVEICVALFV